MKRVFAFAVILVLTCAHSWASCPIDVEKLTKLVVEGDFEKASAYVTKAGAPGECGCDTLDSPCLRFGKMGSDTLSKKEFFFGLKALRQWESSMVAACGELPEKSDDEKKAKQGCFDDRLKQFSDNQINLSKFFSEDLATGIRNKHTASISAYFDKKREATIKVQEDSITHRNSLRAKKITEELCELSKKRRTLAARQKNVARHPNELSGFEQKKKIRIEYDLKKVEADIDRLKSEFKVVAGQPFYLFEWCEK